MNNNIYNKIKIYIIKYDYIMGIGDWGLGIVFYEF